MPKIFQKLSQKTLLIIISVLAVLLVGGGVLGYSQFQKMNSDKLYNSSSSDSKSPNNSQNNSLSNPDSDNSSILSNNSQSNLANNSNSQNNLNLENQKTQNVKLETAILEECDLVIRYNRDKYYLVESQNYYQDGTKLEIREKNLATGNKELLLYGCNSENYTFGNVSNQLQKLFPSSNFKIPLFDKLFWDKTVETGVIEFPGNVELRKEEFTTDFFKVKDDVNFQAGIKTQISTSNLPNSTQNSTQISTQNPQNTKTIFHEMTFRNDPISWSGLDLEFGLKTKESKQTKAILTYQEFQKAEIEEKNLDAKKVKKFKNWEQIKFDGKINKISDIPKDLLDKYGIPQFGFRFYKGVVFWTGYRNNSQDFEDYRAKINQSSSQNSSQSSNPNQEISNQGIIAYDGQKVTELRDETDREIKNYSGYSISTYYVSSLIKDGIGYNFGQSCGGWGCFADLGFFIDFDKGEYWQSKEGIDTEKNGELKVDKKLIQPYLDEDFKIWNGVGTPRITSDTGYKTHRNGKIYGTFQKYTGEIEKSYPKSDGAFIVESDGKDYKFLYPSKLACANPMNPCGDNMVFNSRGNLVYYGDWYEIKEENSNPSQKAENSQYNPENPTMKFIEQDFATGKVLQEEITTKSQEILQKYGINGKL